MDERLRLYKENYTDSEAAAILGITRTAYTAWRIRQELKANYKPGQQKHPHRGGARWKRILVDKLPPVGVNKLLYNSNTDEMFTGYLAVFETHLFMDKSGRVVYPTHWRNLPTPPKKE